MNEAAKNEFPVCDTPDITPEVLYAQAEAKLPHIRFYAPNDMGNAQRFLTNAVKRCATVPLNSVGTYLTASAGCLIPPCKRSVWRVQHWKPLTIKSIAQCQSDQTDPLQNGIQKAAAAA